jgi:hypothetical protein
MVATKFFEEIVVVKLMLNNSKRRVMDSWIFYEVFFGSFLAIESMRRSTKPI